ncbi:MAG: type II toxin-antitoxin system HicB family antitoxin [Desulfobacterales bacterium]|nr:type II toxin-antitoxin system HicB family antitoxin [Desulfobacterales bacterium]
MKGELTAIIEKSPEGGYWAICPEIPGANGQGETIEETKESLKNAIQLILAEDTQKP